MVIDYKAFMEDLIDKATTQGITIRERKMIHKLAEWEKNEPCREE